MAVVGTVKISASKIPEVLFFPTTGPYTTCRRASNKPLKIHG